MTHDPMCPFRDMSRINFIEEDTNRCWGCDLIARVREDEVAKASVVIANLTTECSEARAAGLRDAVEAIEAVDPPSEAYDDWHPKGKRLALAAIEALGGER